MIVLNMLAFIGPGIVVCAYIIACMNEENKEIERFPRWMYLVSIVLTFIGFGSTLSYMMVWNPWLIIPIFMIPGLTISLGRIMTVKDNEIQVIQNTWYTARLDSGRALRLFTRAGLVPLLHGEIFRQTLIEETRKEKITVKNMETEDGSPVNVMIVYWIKPHFSRIQQILETTQDQSEWWDRVVNMADNLITARASDVIRAEEAKEAIGSKKKMSEKLCAEKCRDAECSDLFFKEEHFYGFKIVNMQFADIDLTEAVIAAHEQITKSRAFAESSNTLAKALNIDIKALKDGSPEQEKLLKQLLPIVQANAGKREIVDKNINLSLGGEDPSAIIGMIASHMSKNNKKKRKKK